MKLIKENKWEENPGYLKNILLTQDEIKEGFKLQKVKIKRGESVEVHHHNKQTEVIYFLTTGGQFLINNNEIDIKKGEGVVVEPGDNHRVVNNSDNCFMCLVFKIDYQPNDLKWNGE